VEAGRLLLARGTRQVFSNGLALLGITAPDRM
jgi:arginyl-tRNA synthetase